MRFVAARDEDGGAVLLIDAGDMWQGTLESNLNEGARGVEAYNAMNYTAAAIGNHEFDFGPTGEAAVPQSEADDPRGALEATRDRDGLPIAGRQSDRASLLARTSTGKM